MDKNEVAIINPKIILVTLVPTILIIVSAIRLCRFHFSMAIAKMKPPRNKKMNLCPYAAVVFDRSKPPLKGNRTIGKSAVTAMGKASVIHQIAIQLAEAKTAHPSTESPSGRNRNKKNINESGPVIRPMVFLVICMVYGLKMISEALETAIK